MIDLLDIEHAALVAIVAAGTDGMILDGRELKLSTAVRLEMAGLVSIDHSRPQRVIATAKGRAFRHRGAFA